LQLGVRGGQISGYGPAARRLHRDPSMDTRTAQYWLARTCSTRRRRATEKVGAEPSASPLLRGELQRDTLRLSTPKILFLGGVEGWTGSGMIGVGEGILRGQCQAATGLRTGCVCGHGLSVERLLRGTAECLLVGYGASSERLVRGRKNVGWPRGKPNALERQQTFRDAGVPDLVRSVDPAMPI
jgi:hypothetical protein